MQKVFILWQGHLVWFLEQNYIIFSELESFPKVFVIPRTIDKQMKRVIRILLVMSQ